MPTPTASASSVTHHSPSASRPRSLSREMSPAARKRAAARSRAWSLTTRCFALRAACSSGPHTAPGLRERDFFSGGIGCRQLLLQAHPLCNWLAYLTDVSTLHQVLKCGTAPRRGRVLPASARVSFGWRWLARRGGGTRWLAPASPHRRMGVGTPIARRCGAG
jgi:hypothetical protein